MATSAPSDPAQATQLAQHASAPPTSGTAAPAPGTGSTTLAGSTASAGPQPHATFLDRVVGSMQHALGRATKNQKMEREGEVRKAEGKARAAEVKREMAQQPAHTGQQQQQVQGGGMQPQQVQGQAQGAAM